MTLDLDLDLDADEAQAQALLVLARERLASLLTAACKPNRERDVLRTVIAKLEAAGAPVSPRGAVKEHPILFSGPMVRAILAGDKTQTRRIVQPQPDPAVVRASVVPPWAHFEDEAGPPNERGNRSGRMWTTRCPYGGPGDRLWVRETWGVDRMGGETYYAADEEFGPCAREAGEGPERWRPSIYMPRVLSRIDLEVEAVRVERLQEITEADSRAEGAAWTMAQGPHAGIWEDVPGEIGFIAHFHDLWERINGKRAPWESNPWVWAIQFRRMRP